MAGTNPGWRSRVVSGAVAGLLAVATAAVFWPVGGHDFIHLDDRHYVAGNPALAAGLTPAAVRWAFTSLETGNWHPVTWLSHALDVTLFGLSPGPHHLVNLAWHAAGTVLFFLVLRGATGALWRSAAVAALFALHPLHVESVAWVAERKDVLSVALLGLALLGYVGHVRRSGGARYALALVAYALGLMAKPMLVTAPLLLVLLDFWPFDRLRRDARSCLLEKLPFALAAAGVAAVTAFAQSRAGAIAPIWELSVPARVANAVIAAATYLVKTVWPHPLAIYYPLGDGFPPVGRLIGAAALLAGLVAVSWRWLRCAPWFSFGLGWYAVTLLPVSGIVQAGQQSLADRYAYLPLTGAFVAFAWGAQSLLAKRVGVRALAVAAVLLLVPMVAATRSYLSRWQNSVTLFTHAVEAVPGNWYMHYNLGILAGARGDVRAAIRHYEECVRLRPRFADAYNNLGQLQAATGKPAEARRTLSTALHLNPSLDAARFNLALLDLREGRRAEALGALGALQRAGSFYAPTLEKMLAR